MSTKSVSYSNNNVGAAPQYPTMAPPQQSTCQCPDCMAMMGYSYSYNPYSYPAPSPQYPGAYTHSPYSFSQPQVSRQTQPQNPQLQPRYQSKSAPEPVVVPRRRAASAVPEISDTSSHSSRDNGRQDSADDDDFAGITPMSNVSINAIKKTEGRVVSISCTAHGSSFLQCALRQFPSEAFEIVMKEIQPVMSKLMSDKNGCYVVKLLLEMMTHNDALGYLSPMLMSDDLMILLCTKDLHSRRMVQFMLDFAGADFCRPLYDLVMRRPMDIVRTQQGCITMQRILDHYTREEKEAFFEQVRANFMEFTLDPFGNYIVQYMLTEGDQVENSSTLVTYCQGQIHNMVCHKYASNVIEKCFGLVTPELQHAIIEELFTGSDVVLSRVLTDSSANYVVQAAIRAASYRDVAAINQRVAPLLLTIPYGKKIQQRLNRRLNH